MAACQMERDFKVVKVVKVIKDFADCHLASTYFSSMS